MQHAMADSGSTFATSHLHCLDKADFQIPSSHCDWWRPPSPQLKIWAVAGEEDLYSMQQKTGIQLSLNSLLVRTSSS